MSAAPPRPARPPALALIACALVLTTLSFAQVPGKVAFDTKFDLVQNPASFLSRALHLWDPTSGFGQVQNQAVGYLFPMGPFFDVAHALGISPWITQRAWIAIVLVVAMWGMARLAAALQIGSGPGWIVAGLAYALAPCFTGQVGFVSAAMLPAALLPWTILPLISGAAGGSPRRAAARSGLAIVLMGGVNATAVLAVLVLPAIYLITREAGPRRRALMLWWPVCVGLACFWWAACLVFQGRYGIDLIAYTETATVTGSTTAAAEVLRGAGNWLAYLNLGQPWVPPAWTLVSAAAAIIATAAVSAAGLAGLAGRGTRERQFLIASLGFATAVICAGYTGELQGAFTGLSATLLGGALAPFRNVYKFEPVIAAVVALGIASLVSRLAALGGERAGRPRRLMLRFGVPACVLALVAVAALPLLQGDGTTGGAFKATPAYWSQASDWLGAHAARETTLLLPASAFAEYRWGRPLDEPMQALERGPWAVRLLQPLGGVANTRLLDGIERILTTQSDAPGLRDALRRMGIRYVVARNDLDWRRTASPRPVQVRAALVRAGLRRVARFGPRLSRAATTERFLPDLGLTKPEERLSAVEIYAVDPKVQPVTTFPAVNPTVISGGPESTLELADWGGLRSRATILAADLTGPLPAGARWVVSDALRRGRTDFGLVHDNTSYTLERSENAAGTRSTPQLLPAALEGHEAVASTPQQDGSVTASSYGSWLLQLPELQPAGAFDHDVASAWVAGSPTSSQGQWVQAELGASRPVTRLSVRLLHEGPFRPRILSLRVTTDRGSVTTQMADTEASQPLQVVPGPTRTVRVTIGRVIGERPGEVGAGLREIAIPGIAYRRFISPPQEEVLMRWSREHAANPTFLFTRLTADPNDLLRRDAERQLRREFTMPADGQMRLSGRAVPVPGPRLDALLTRTRGVTVRASSTYRSLPQFRAANAFDRTRSTVWIAAPPTTRALSIPSAPGITSAGTGLHGAALSPVPVVTDQSPALRVTFARDATLRSVRVGSPGGFAAVPEAIRITSAQGTRDVAVSHNRLATFAPLRTDAITITFPRVSQRFTNGPAGERVALPVGVSDIDFPALRGQSVIALPPSVPLGTQCGGGPDITIDGRRIRTRLDTTVGDANALVPATMRLCSSAVLPLAGGDHQVQSRSGQTFAISDLKIAPTRQPAAPAPGRREARVQQWGVADRRIAMSAGPATLLEVHQNPNAGWTATMNGRALAAQTLDGWQQGILVPAGAAGVVVLTYSPDRPFRLLLLFGGLLALTLVPLALVPARGRGRALVAAPVGAAGAPGRLGRWAWIAAMVLAVVAVSWPMVVALPPLAWLRRRAPGLLAPLAAAALLASGVITAIAQEPFFGAHGGAFGWPAQALATLALAAVLILLATERQPPRAGAEAEGADVVAGAGAGPGAQR